MKIYQKLGGKIVLSLAVGFLLLMPLSAVLAEQDNGNLYLPSELTLENVLFAAGQNININAQSKDDLYLAGANIVISGPVEGDIIAVGSNIVINSEVKGNVRVVGGTVTINGKVDKNVTVGAGNLTVSTDAEIGKNLILGAGNAEINGKINKNLYVGAGNLILNSEILGNAYLSIDSEGDLLLYSHANIHGNLEYSAKNQVEIAAGAQIQGETKFNQMQKEPQSALKTKMQGFIFAFWLASLFGALIVGLFLITLFKDFTVKVQNNIDKNILSSVLRGLAYLIVTPIALIILAATIIGLPLAFILGALYFIALYLSLIFIGIYWGDKFLKLFNKNKEVSLLWAMLIGMLIIYILFALPFIGWFLKLIAICWSLGVFIEILKKELKLEKV